MRFELSVRAVRTVSPCGSDCQSMRFELSVHAVRTVSPCGSDCQSMRFGLSVHAVRTVSPNGLGLFACAVIQLYVSTENSLNVMINAGLSTFLCGCMLSFCGFRFTFHVLFRNFAPYCVIMPLRRVLIYIIIYIVYERIQSSRLHCMSRHKGM